MITLEQFEKAITESRPLYCVTTDFEVDEFTPGRYEVDLREDADDRILTYNVASSDNWYYHAERCFETIGEAKSELKKMLESKLKKLA